MTSPSLPNPSIESRLQELLNVPLSLRITDNTRSMITVKWKNGACAVRLHQMFLDATEEILRVLADFIRRPSLLRRALLRDFIRNHEEKIRVRPTPPRPRTPRLHPEGTHVDLKPHFHRLNEFYFGGRLGCSVTWGIRKRGRRPRTMRLGTYCPDQRLIRIHPVLDSPAVPAYVIEDVLYHEMLHHELGLVRTHGRILAHHREFKRIEKAFPHHAKAREWIHKNLSWLLTSARRG